MQGGEEGLIVADDTANLSDKMLPMVGMQGGEGVDKLG